MSSQKKVKEILSIKHNKETLFQEKKFISEIKFHTKKIIE